MKIKDLFTFWKRSKEVPQTQSFDEYVKNSVVTLDQLFEKGNFGKTNPVSQPAKNSYLVYKCSQILADRLPKVPLKFIDKRTQDQIDPDSNEAAAFIMEPGDTTFFDFLSRSIMFYALYGEAFWVWNDSVGTELGVGKVPAGLTVVDPTAMTEDLTEYFDLKGWLYNAAYKNNEINMYLPKENVIQVKNANPYNMWRGLRAIDAIANELGIDVKSAQEMVRFYDNFAIPGTILTAPADSPITPEDMEAMVKKFNSRHAGIDKRFKTAGFSGGIVPHVLGLPQDKQQLIETKQFIRDTVLAVFGVPLTYAGYTEGINRATAEAQERNFWQGGSSLLLRFQHTINRKIINRIDPTIECAFDLDSIDALKKDINEAAEAATKMMAMGWSANDLNEKFNWDLPEYDGITDKHYQPFNLVEIGELPIWMQQEGGDKPKKPDQKADKPAGGGRVSKKPPTPTEAAKKAQKNTVEDQMSGQEIRDAFLEIQSANEKIFKNKISRYFFDQRIAILQILGGTTNSMEDSFLKELAYKAMAKMSQVFESESKRLIRSMTPHYEKAVLDGQQHAINSIGADRNVILNRQIVSTHVNRLTGINVSTFKRIKQQIMDGVNEGESVAQIASRIKTVYNYTTTRAKVIARTETSTVINAATQEEYRQNGIERKRWLTARDDRVRESCRLAESQGGIPVEHTFANGLMYPQVPNCRCCISPAIRR